VEADVVSDERDWSDTGVEAIRSEYDMNESRLLPVELAGPVVGGAAVGQRRLVRLLTLPIVGLGLLLP
jgi:hypothetical protein